MSLVTARISNTSSCAFAADRFVSHNVVPNLDRASCLHEVAFR